MPAPPPTTSSQKKAQHHPIIGKYQLGDQLGTGAFSEVKIGVERSTGQKFAVKIIDKAKCKGKETMIDTEVNILKRARHDHIIKLYEMYEIDNKIYLIMELVTGGELFDDIVRRGKYTEADAARIVHKVLLAIEYLHELGIAHRDLKPENLLLSDKSSNPKIMISDFGLSKIFNDDEVMKTACGTPGYVAPEVLQRKGYGKEVDLWSLGVITYILLCGYPPFYDQNNVELFKQIMAGKYEFDRPWWDNISESARDFIRHLLVLDPRSRYTAREALAHPYITNSCGTPEQNEAKRAAAAAAAAAKEAQATNLAPMVASNLQRVYSSKASLKVGQGASEGDLGSIPLNAVLDGTAMGSNDSVQSQPGRPIKEGHTDSGVVTSNESVNSKKRADNGKRPSSSKSPDTSGRSINEQALRTFPFPPTPYTIRLLTYNVFLRPPGIKNNVSDHKSARLIRFGEHSLPKYDVVCMQEVFAYGSSRQGKMISYARKAGLEYYVSSPSKGLLNAMIDGGLLILSRYPIVRSEKLTFKRGVHSDRFSAKGALYAKIAVSPTAHIHVFTTHLQSTYEIRATLSDASVVTRLNQLVALKEFIDDCTRNKPANEPIFLAGTLNVNAKADKSGAAAPGSETEEYTIMLRLLRGEIAIPPTPTADRSATPAGNTSSQTSSEGATGASTSPTSPTSPLPAPTPMRVRDLVYESMGVHPVTFGDVTEDGKPRETVLTAVDSLKSCGSIDYVFCLNGANSNASAGDADEVVKVEQKGTRVDKFLVEGEPFTQLSDHYGISTMLQVA
ncbi:calcium calmodulin-dependent protein kinase type 1G [Borealophlyctis nickersoniae]|nr:calcium calmodulin-dependent protein kinase type 1G [Borealophlyctis nickersoniae]